MPPRRSKWPATLSTKYLFFIKLKNISGKVVIDPVASDQNTLRKLVGMLKNEFRDDLSITNVYGYTRGGLLELSRSRNDRYIDELNL